MRRTLEKKETKQCLYCVTLACFSDEGHESVSGVCHKVHISTAMSRILALLGIKYAQRRP